MDGDLPQQRVRNCLTINERILAKVDICPKVPKRHLPKGSWPHGLFLKKNGYPHTGDQHLPFFSGSSKDCNEQPAGSWQV